MVSKAMQTESVTYTQHHMVGSNSNKSGVMLVNNEQQQSKVGERSTSMPNSTGPRRESVFTDADYEKSGSILVMESDKKGYRKASVDHSMDTPVSQVQVSTKGRLLNGIMATQSTSLGVDIGV